ncbi:cupin domain-containing protein [Stappia stellulata]|uniref:cupin domain-containing protein n=1 Tax=Stappia stellulata TaxID=71235 RepID=UPI001CD38D91|nr:cupin domain-containing protein [Stappia stellulata]MCA1244599.1 cupin domain-containing protein [Stappia stellulata]
MTATVTLADLLSPLSPDRFVREVFEVRPMLFEARGRAFDGLFGIERVDEMLSSLTTRSALVRLYRNGEPVARKDYERVRRLAGERHRDFIDYDAVVDQHLNGATINLRFVERRSAALAALCRECATVFASASHASAFLTPPRSHGLRPHYDLIDAFMLQVSGEKRWDVWVEDCNRLALRTRGYDPETVRRQVAARPPDHSFLLRPGDVLYLPRGFTHVTYSNADCRPSLHVAVSVDPVRTHDVVQTEAERLLETYKGRYDLRRCVRAAGASAFPDESAQVAAIVETQFEAFVEDLAARVAGLDGAIDGARAYDPNPSGGSLDDIAGRLERRT